MITNKLTTPIIDRRILKIKLCLKKIETKLEEEKMKIDSKSDRQQKEKEKGDEQDV